MKVLVLGSEQPDQLSDFQRRKAFVERCAIMYPSCCDKAAVPENLPQAINPGAWPIPFFLGRNGWADEAAPSC